MRLYFLSFLVGGIMTIQAANYGTWDSPITSQKVVEGQIQLRQLEVDKEEIYWLESRPEEKGRSVFVRFNGLKDLFNAPFNARTTVHEYGGQSGVFHDGTLYFSNFQDQNIYYVEEGEKPTLLIDAAGKRFGDFCIHPNGKWLYAVMEDHTAPLDVKNSLVKIDVEEKSIETLTSGHDFYASPRVDPEGNQIVFYFWDHPNLPWDGTTLILAELDQKGLIETEKKIAGGISESAVEPRWSPKGELYFVSDRNGYWNLYDEENELVCEMNADFTVPPWLLGPSEYTFFEKDGKSYIAAIITEKAIDSLLLIDLKEKSYSKANLEYTMYSGLKTKKDSLVFIGASPKKNPEIVLYNPKENTSRVLYKTKEIGIDESYISEPKTIEFPTDQGKTAFAFYYAPKNPRFKASLTETPPLIVYVHGGPTGHVNSALKLQIQFWTSRGFAVADLNYGGSTGFGREYRDRLKNSWGKTDVNDACALATYLTSQKLADPKRLAIRGGSAGGYTVLSCLTFRDTFQIGTSLYGVCDLELLAKDTHKFESRYLDSLIGPYPEEKEKYKALSPIAHTELFSKPLLLLQGADDKVVPPEQSEKVYQVLLKKKIPTAYILFEGEQHGFRQAQNMIRALDAEFFFYCTLFQIETPDKTVAIPIANLLRGAKQ